MSVVMTKQVQTEHAAQESKQKTLNHAVQKAAQPIALGANFPRYAIWTPKAPMAAAPQGPHATAKQAQCQKTKTCDEALAHKDGELAYSFDGTFEGMLTCVYLSCKLRENPTDLIAGDSLQLRFGQEERVVTTDIHQAKLVRRSILRSFGSDVFDFIQCAAAADSPAAALTVCKFTRRLLGQCKACSGCSKKGSCVNPCQIERRRVILDDLADPLTFELHRLRCSVLNEREKMVQFIRFEHMEGDVWFARCNPKAKVVPLLMGWFIARFNTQQFIIFDETHKVSGFFDGRSWGLIQGDITPPSRLGNEEDMQDAWRRYFKSLCVTERHHPELQRQFMPKRYWKNITEMQEIA